MSVDHNTIVRVLLRDRAKLFAYVWSIVRDVHMAEDVFQEVSLLAVDKSDEIESEQVLGAWLRTTARFRSLRALENAHRTATPLDEQMLDRLDAHWGRMDEQASHEVVDALRVCLAKLTPRARNIVRMRYVDGLAGNAVAAAIGGKVETVYKSLARAHRALGECIRRQLGDAAR